MPCVDQQQVACLHPHVHGDVLGIREVDVAHQVQRLVIIGIETEVLQQQMAAHDAYRVVVEAHADTVGDADEIGLVDIHLTVYVGMGGGTFDGQRALAVALKTHQLVGHETVGQGEWHTGHREGGVDLAVVACRGCLVDTAEQAELLIVEHQTGLDGMGVVFLHQIHQFGADVADGRALVGHVVDGHVGDHGDMLLLVYQDVVVAM